MYKAEMICQYLIKRKKLKTTKLIEVLVMLKNSPKDQTFAEKHILLLVGLSKYLFDTSFFLELLCHTPMLNIEV